MLVHYGFLWKSGASEVVTVINFDNFKDSSALLHNSMKIANYEI